MSKETNLKFPCVFPIKVMGNTGIDFEGKVIAIIRKHVPDLGEGAIKSRFSKDGNYQSLTITINAQSKEQLDAIYQDLKKEKEVLVSL